MNKTAFGLALAMVVAAGAGYGVFSYASHEKAEAGSEKAEGAKEAAIEAAEEMSSEEGEEAAATEPAAADSDNPVVAKVDGMDVHRSEVLEFMENLPPQMKQLPLESLFPMVLEQVVNGKIIDLRAEKAGFASNPEVTKRMEQAKTQIVRGVYAEQQIEENYDEDETKKAYDKMVAGMPKVDEVKASHILVSDEATAKEVIKKLEDGAKFADLAKEYSQDKSNAGNGGDLGYFSQGDMVKEFGDAAFALKKGETTKTPVKTQFGYHIIMQEDKRPRPAPKYDDVKEQISAQTKRELLNKLVEDWRKDASVQMFDYNGTPLPKEGPKKGYIEDSQKQKEEEKSE